MTGNNHLTKQERKNTVRFLAMTILVKVAQEEAYANIALHQLLQQKPLISADRHLLTELVYGVLQRQMTLDAIMAPYVTLAKNPLWLQQLLRLSVFQLCYLDRVPAHAIIYEAVEIAKIKGHLAVGKFVNGVLRNVQRHGRKRLAELTHAPETLAQLAVATSVPEQLLAYWQEHIGWDETVRLANALLDKPTLTLRVQGHYPQPNGDREAVIAALAQEGVQATAQPLSPVAITAQSGDVLHTETFLSGRLTVQDMTSMLVAPLGQLEPHFSVLDACAAPGGKTTHMASYLDVSQNGKITALDLHEHKGQLIRDNAARLGVADVITVQQGDARHCHQQFPAEHFDVAFVDAPCSGLGLMRRKPEMKYRKQVSDFTALQHIQLEILASVAPTVKKHGKIIYSTCTVTHEENAAVVAAFLQRHPEYSLEPLHEDLPQFATALTPEGMLQVYPHYYGTDGFFIARLVKS